MVSARCYSIIKILINMRNFKSTTCSLYCIKLFFIAIFMWVGVIKAQTPINPTTWTGSPASAAGASAFTTLPATITPGAASVNISQWDRGAVVFNAAAACYNSNNWQVGGTLAAAEAANKCVFFTITNSAATELQVTNVVIRSQVSATGPQNVQMTCSIGAVTTNFGAVVATAHSATPEVWNLTDNICIGPGQTATFRLYGWGGTGTAGTLRINDGTAVIAGFATPVSATASSSSPVCTGELLSFTGTASGGIPGYTYSWSGPDGFSSTMLSPSIPSVASTAAGVYTLVVTDALNCSTTSVPVTTTVTVNTSPAPITGTTHVCPLLTTTLSSLSAGGTWSSSNTGIATVGAATGIVTGVAAGTATITYTVGTLCFATTTVTVDTPPSAITGNLSVCVAASGSLTVTPAPGTWTIDDITKATIGSATGIVTGISAGTANVTYTTASGCIAVAIQTVHPLPVAIAGPSGVCIGASVTLTNATSGGTWISSNTTIATIGSLSGVVTANAIGTTTISYILTTTGCYVTRVQTVNPLPSSITGPTNVCPGLTITLSSSPAGGTWTVSDPTIISAGAASGIITGVNSGTAIVTYTLPTGCSITRGVTVDPAPAANITPLGDTVFCPGGFVVLTANTGAGLSYQWYVGAAPISGATAATYTALVTGSYRVRVTNTLACPRMSAAVSVLVDAATATITVPGGVYTSCTGTPILLNANTGVGLTYQWLLGGVAIPGATGSTYAAGASGDHTVIVTNASGCAEESAPVNLVFYPAPSNAIAASGPITFCEGGSVVLSAASDPIYTYQWYDGAGIIAGATTLSYTATTSGAYYVSITNSYGCVINTATANVVVNPLPNVAISLSGPRAFCEGTGVTLTATAAAGLNYQWYRSGVAIAGATGNVYYATTSGGYRVRVWNTITGCSDITHADTTLTLINIPVILPLTPSRFCWGGSSLLSTSVAGAGTSVNYQWYRNAAAIAGATNSTYSATADGAYTCKVSVTGGCSLTGTAIQVTQMPLPNPVITATGSILKAQSFYVAYKWYKNLNPVAGGTTQSIIHSGIGNYKVMVTDTNGCQSVSDNYVVNTTTGVFDAESASQINIYPVPVSGRLFIEGAEDVRAVLMSVDGKVLTDTFSVREIDMSSCADGLYLLAFYKDGMLIKNAKVVKAAQ